jgi:hypothetical protein
MHPPEQPNLCTDSCQRIAASENTDRRVFERLTWASLLVLATFGDRVAGGMRR